GEAGGDDRDVVLALGYLVFLASVVISTPGPRTQHRIERTEWLMMGWVLLFLLGVGFFFVPNDAWTRVAAGFVSPLLGQPPPPLPLHPAPIPPLPAPS